MNFAVRCRSVRTWTIANGSWWSNFCKMIKGVVGAVATIEDLSKQFYGGAERECRGETYLIILVHGKRSSTALTVGPRQASGVACLTRSSVMSTRNGTALIAPSIGRISMLQAQKRGAGQCHWTITWWFDNKGPFGGGCAGITHGVRDYGRTTSR